MIVEGQAEVPPKKSRAVIWIAALAGSGHKAALDWLAQQAATPANITAQARLGQLYAATLADQGPPERQAKGVVLLQDAAAWGDAFAQHSLAKLYSTGSGVEQDYVLAHKWANLAATRGSRAAAKSRALFAKLMTPEQIAQAQKLAREYVAKN